METITITLPVPPRELSPNGRTHWAVKARHVKEARTLAQVEAHNAMICAGFPKQAKWERAKVTAKVIKRDRRGRMDDDNFKASCKSYCDGVCDAGLILNDRGLEWGDVAYVIDKAAEPHVELTFVSIDPAANP